MLSVFIFHCDPPVLAAVGLLAASFLQALLQLSTSLLQRGKS